MFLLILSESPIFISYLSILSMFIKAKPLENMQKAFIARDKLGIMDCLDAEDVVDFQDAKSIHTQLFEYYKKLSRDDIGMMDVIKSPAKIKTPAKPRPVECEEIYTELKAIETRMKSLTEEECLCGAGDELIERLKQQFPVLKTLRRAHPDVKLILTFLYICICINNSPCPFSFPSPSLLLSSYTLCLASTLT